MKWNLTLDLWRQPHTLTWHIKPFDLIYITILADCEIIMYSGWSNFMLITFSTNKIILWWYVWRKTVRIIRTLSCCITVKLRIDTGSRIHTVGLIYLYWEKPGAFIWSFTVCTTIVPSPDACSFIWAVLFGCEVWIFISTFLCLVFTVATWFISGLVSLYICLLSCGCCVWMSDTVQFIADKTCRWNDLNILYCVEWDIEPYWLACVAQR